jgi:hypothetical protein
MPAFSTYIGHMTTEHTHSTEQRLLSVIICKKNNYHDDDDDKWKNKISERTKKFKNFLIDNSTNINTRESWSGDHKYPRIPNVDPQHGVKV